MIPVPDDAQLVLDTSPLGHMVLQTVIHERLYADYKLDTRAPAPMISWVSRIEIQVSARHAQWGRKKRDGLDKILSQTRTIALDTPKVVDWFIELSVLAIRKGRNPGKHDIWIAATAAAHDAWLLTQDTDFDVFHHQGVIRRILYDPKTGRRLD